MTEPAARGLGKGIKSVHDLKYVQDGPPAGGFPAIRYARRLGTPGPTGVAIFGVGAAICCYGFYRVGQANQKRNAYLREKAAARKALLPILQAEEDIRYVEEVKRLEQREKDIRGRAGGHHGSAGAAGGSVTTSTVSSTGFWRPAVKPLGSKDQI